MAGLPAKGRKSDSKELGEEIPICKYRGWLEGKPGDRFRPRRGSGLVFHALRVGKPRENPPTMAVAGALASVL